VFSRSEESRLLASIRTHKHGLVQWDTYEEKRCAHETLSKSHEAKRAELDENWRASTDLSQKLNIIKEEQLKFLGEECQSLAGEIATMQTSKIALKKELEDRIRDNVLMKQKRQLHHQATSKSASASTSNKNKQSVNKQIKNHSNEEKGDEKETGLPLIDEMEEYFRDYTKLINYFQKLTATTTKPTAATSPSSPSSFNMPLPLLSISKSNPLLLVSTTRPNQLSLEVAGPGSVTDEASTTPFMILKSSEEQTMTPLSSLTGITSTESELSPSGGAFMFKKKLIESGGFASSAISSSSTCVMDHHSKHQQYRHQKGLSKNFIII
jgi:hypothetical protein